MAYVSGCEMCAPKQAAAADSCGSYARRYAALLLRCSWVIGLTHWRPDFPGPHSFAVDISAGRDRYRSSMAHWRESVRSSEELQEVVEMRVRGTQRAWKSRH